MKRATLGTDVIRWVLTILLLAGGLAMVFPIFWLFSTSFRPAPELLKVPPSLLPEQWTLDNYSRKLLDQGLITELPLVVAVATGPSPRSHFQAAGAAGAQAWASGQ